MKRDTKALADTGVDLLVVGGGIYGATIAREAALRGLRVSLIERQDFGAATSANSHKIIHGGLRYLQHLDLPRVRESIHERATLERIAPHLVHPLPVAVPTYGHGLRGKELLGLGVALHRLLRTVWREPHAGVVDGLSPGPLSRSALVELLPGLADSPVTGGVVFYDSQVQNSERLLLAFLRSAADSGALLANYVEATGFLRERGRVTGVTARDALDGAPLEIRAATVVNAAGPWIAKLLGSAGLGWHDGRLVRAVNIVTRQIVPRVAAGLYGRAPYDDAHAVLSRGQRLYFLVPWRDRTIIGTSYSPYEGDPSCLTVGAADVEELISEVNYAYPSAALRLDDVSLVYSGLLPSSGVSQRTGEIQVANRYRIEDHASAGFPGLFSVEGVKYTTARDVAVRVVDRVLRASGKTPPPSRTGDLVLPGGAIGRFDEFLHSEVRRRPELPVRGLERLVRTYGAAYEEVFRHLGVPVAGAATAADEEAILRAEVVHAVRDESAMTLGDVVLRRTEIGATGHPGRGTLERVAAVLAAELSWTSQRTEREIAEVEARYGVPKAR